MKTSIGNELVKSSDRALVSQKGNIVVNSWTGGGYAVEGAAKGIMKISGNLNGGYNTVDNDTYNVPLIITEYNASPGFEISNGLLLETSHTPLTTEMQYSWDPVEMVSGAYVLNKTDLVVGSAPPFGLQFGRQYHSNRRYDDSSGLGYGWTHSGNILITERSSTDAALGQVNSYQAAPFLAAVVAAKDLHTDHVNAKEWATAALVVHWALEQMRYNAVSVTMGPRSIQFVKMPDGTFISPPGMNLTLSGSSGSYVLTERHGNTLTFNAENKVASIANSSGAIQTFTYTSGKLSQITDSHSRSLTYQWSGESISSVSDGTGRTVSFGYSDGNMTSFTDAESKQWTYQYDSEHRMISLKDPQNRFIAENDYDTESRVIRQRSMGDATREWQYLYAGYVNTEINPQNGVSRYYHDERGRSIGVEDALGLRNQMSYDGQDRTILQTTPKGEDVVRIFNADNNLLSETDPLNHTVYYFYDSALRLQKATDKRGKDTTYTYSSSHQVETVTDPLNHVTTYGYYPNGLLNTVTDAEGKTTTTAFDSWGNVNKITLHDGTFTTFSSNARGDLLSSLDAENRTSSNTWNKRRQLLTSTSPAISGEPAATVTNAYDDSGNLASSQDANGNVTSYTWNALGKGVTTTQSALAAGNNVITASYDTRDWLIQTGNSSGHTVTHEYDAAKRMTASVDALTRRTENTFDANGSLLETKDPLNRITKSVWNDRGEMERSTDGENKNTDYLFDNNGNQTSLTNRRGKAYTFSYDDANRATSITTPTSKVTSMTYFDNNLLKTTQEPSGDTTTFAYNDRNQLQTKTDAVGAITYTHDDSGLVLTVTEGTSVISRTYDERGRIKTYTNDHGDLLQYKYDANNNLVRLTYPDSKEVDYTYNARNLLKTVTDWQNRVTTYQYDRLGTLTGITRPNGTSLAVDRDAAGQLLSMKESVNGNLFSYLKLGYDLGGQVKSRFHAPVIHSAFQHPTFTGTYDDDNRLTAVNSNAIVHDDDGNMTTGPIRSDSGNVSLVYNARNQLVQADGLTYSYDAEGHRRNSTDANGATRYTIDPNTSMSRLLVSYAPDGTKTYYVYGAGLLYEVDESENTKTYHYDQVGSSISRTDDAGKVIGRAEYTAYGIMAWQQGDMETPFQYNGQWGIMTEANGLLNMRARYYSPYLMRFLNADPIGFSGGQNWFSYADGNPISKLDPFGLWGWKSVAWNFAKGVVVGVVITAVVVIAAPVVVSIGAAALVSAGVAAATATTIASATVTAGLGVAAVVGTAATVIKARNDIENGDWDELAYTTGNLVGGLAVGSAGGGRYIADNVGSTSSTVPKSWNPLADSAWKYQSGKGSMLEWLATAPTPQSGGASAAFTATGVASGIELYRTLK